MESLEHRWMLTTITVTSTSDVVDPNDGLVTLREALAADQIEFAIPADDPGHVYYRDDGADGQVSRSHIVHTTEADDRRIADIDPDWAHSWFTIPLQAELLINRSVNINGYTQPGSIANTVASGGLETVLKIEVDASQTDTTAHALNLERGIGTKISGLVVHGAKGTQSQIHAGANAPSPIIAGNFLGTDVSGTIALGGNSFGVHISNQGENGGSIGGDQPAERNLIAGGQYGIYVRQTHGVQIQGNLIGTDAEGANVLGLRYGVYLFGADNSLIGGVDPYVGNVISTGSGFGIYISSSSSENNRIQGNYLGLDVSGTLALGNGIGISERGSGTMIGGGDDDDGQLDGTVHARNVISASSDSVGIDLRAPVSGATVQGNYIGTDVTGQVAMGNYWGIRVGDSTAGTVGNQIGGAGDGEGNLISANAYGVWIQHRTTRDNKIQGNQIGVAADGTALGNVLDGVYFRPAYLTSETTPAVITIGGSSDGEGNTIAYNGQSGIRIDSSGSAAQHPHGVLSILGNSIYSNTELGIDLLERDSVNNRLSGVTANDDGDVDQGPNLTQNYPVLKEITVTGNVLYVEGTINSTPDTTFRIEFFSTPGTNRNGFGEGESYLGFTQTTTDANGDAAFAVDLLLEDDLPAGYTITSTATDSAGATSEFSGQATAIPPNSPTATDNVNSIMEDSAESIDGNFMTDDDGFGVDLAPDGDELTVIGVAGAHGLVTDPIQPAEGDYGILYWGTSGSYEYALVDAPRLQALSAGATATETFTYTIAGVNGATGTATLTITIHGENDPPVAGGLLNFTASAGDESFQIDLLSGASDPDNNDTLSINSISKTSGNDGGIQRIDNATLQVFPSSGNYLSLSEGESETISYVISISDSNGAQAARTLLITITGINNLPVASDNLKTFAIDAATMQGNLMTDDDGFGVDEDLDEGDALSVVQVGDVTDSQTDVAGDYGVLDWESDGSYRYTANAEHPDVAALELGDALFDAFTYVVDDGHGGSDTATLTIAVTVPVVDNNWRFVSDEDNSGDVSRGDLVRETISPASLGAVYGVSGFGSVATGAITGAHDSFDQINDAIFHAGSGSTVTILPGTYSESVTINHDLTLTGKNPNASHVVIDPDSVDGITINSAANHVTIKNLRVTGAETGITAAGIAGGLLFHNVQSIDNDVHGIEISDVGGDVELIQLLVQDNGSGGANFVGDGLRLVDGDDEDQFAVGGELSIRGGTIGTTPFGRQTRGIFTDAIAGSIMIGGYDADDNGQIDLFERIKIERNWSTGMQIRHDGTGTVTFSDVDAIDNFSFGIALRGSTGTTETPSSVLFTDVDASSNWTGGILVSSVVIGDVDFQNVNAMENEHIYPRDDFFNLDTPPDFTGTGIALGMEPDGVLTTEDFFNTGGQITGDVSFENVHASGNGRAGIYSKTVDGDVNLQNVTSSLNLRGAYIFGAVSVTDDGGSFWSNKKHGIHLEDIWGDVELIRTNLTNNDADGGFQNGFEGDGLHAVKGDENDSVAIGGDLIVRGASFAEAAPGATKQQRGVFVEGVGGVLTFEAFVDSQENTYQPVTVDNNGAAGILIDGTVGNHLPDDFFGATVRLNDVTISNNNHQGVLFAERIFGNVAFTDVTATNNRHGGIEFDGEQIGDINFVDVTASNNGQSSIAVHRNGVTINAAESFTDTDGSYTANDDDGMQLIDIAGDVRLIRTSVEDNDANEDGDGNGIEFADGDDSDTFAIGGGLIIQDTRIIAVDPRRSVFLNDIGGDLTIDGSNGLMIMLDKRDFSVSGDATLGDLSLTLIDSKFSVGNRDGEHSMLTIGEAALLTLDARSSVEAGTILIESGGVVAGHGEIITHSLVNHGHILPGTSPGQLTINGDFEQGHFGTLVLEIGGTTPITEHDVLYVTGDATFDGTVQVVFVEGFTQEPDQTIQTIVVGGELDLLGARIKQPEGAHLIGGIVVVPPNGGILIENFNHLDQLMRMGDDSDREKIKFKSKRRGSKQHVKLTRKFNADVSSRWVTSGDEASDVVKRKRSKIKAKYQLGWGGDIVNDQNERDRIFGDAGRDMLIDDTGGGRLSVSNLRRGGGANGANVLDERTVRGDEERDGFFALFGRNWNWMDGANHALLDVVGARCCETLAKANGVLGGEFEYEWGRFQPLRFFSEMMSSTNARSIAWMRE